MTDEDITELFGTVGTIKESGIHYDKRWAQQEGEYSHSDCAGAADLMWSACVCV